ncbi:MAG: hypothetical protein ABJN40_02920 [Sneathiella sp.]
MAERITRDELVQKQAELTQTVRQFQVGFWLFVASFIGFVGFKAKLLVLESKPFWDVFDTPLFVFLFLFPIVLHYIHQGYRNAAEKRSEINEQLAALPPDNE